MSSDTLRESYLRLLKGSVLTKISSTFLFLIISNLLSIEEFSIYTIFFASIEILIVIVSLGYPSYILRVQDKHNAVDALIQSNNFSFINSLLLFAIAVISFKISNVTSLSFIFLSDNLVFFFLILFFKSYVNNYRNYYVTSHQSNKILSLDIYCFLVDSALIILILLVFTSVNLIFLIRLVVISNFLKFLFFVFKEIKFKLKKPIYNFNASPFFLKSIIGLVGVYYSRYFLESTANYNDLAIYGFYFMIVSQGINLVSEPFSKTYLPKLRDKNDINFNKIFQGIKKYSIYSLIFLSMIFISILIFIFSNFNIPFFKIEYQENIFMLLYLTFIFLLSNLRIPFTIWMYTPKLNINKLIILMSLLDLILSIILYPIFYNFFGLYGIPSAYLINVLLVNGFHFFVFNKKIRIA